MAGTFSQVYIHIVFSVKHRANLLDTSWRVDVFKYIAGIIQAKGHKSIIVNGVSDHIHILVGLKPAFSIADLVRDIKNNSAKFVNEKGFLSRNFAWQEGYGAFSCSHREMDRVYQYILNQEEHHKNSTFQSEYLQLLDDFQVEYNENYVFDYPSLKE